MDLSVDRADEEGNCFRGLKKASEDDLKTDLLSLSDLLILQEMGVLVDDEEFVRAWELDWEVAFEAAWEAEPENSRCFEDNEEKTQ